MKKLFKEFKQFISRGNVMDLAVGMIIGAAFTAIVTALTTNILRPLINWIIFLVAGSEGVGNVYTFLVGSVEDLESAIYIDWGLFISAIINFILIAIVLFIIVKAFNKAKSGIDKVKGDYKVLEKEEVKALRKEGKSLAEIRAIDAEKAKEKEEEAKRAAEEEANKLTRSEAFLAEIRDLLKAKAESEAAVEEKAEADEQPVEEQKTDAEAKE